MRKLSALLALLLVATFASAQSFETFESAFKDFSSDMASSLALNATTGSNWSDAYVGGFPHFGAGLAIGAAFTGKGSAEPLFEALGQEMPSGLENLGIPIPAAALTFKIGLPIIPVDVGLTGGVIPASLGEKLGDASVEYKNIGAQARVAIIKEKLLFPDLSFGLGLSYQQGSASAKMGAGDQTIISETLGSDLWEVTASDPDMQIEWESLIVDATLQVSKRFLFIRPYAGLGYSFGKSTVDGGVASDLTITQNGNPATYQQLASALEAAGGDAPSLSASGFSYKVEATDPVFRLYGGMSFHLLIALDAQFVYVPATEALAASLSARFQL